MFEMIITALAGAAIGIVAMRLLQQGRAEKTDATNSDSASTTETRSADSPQAGSRFSRNQLIYGGAVALFLAGVLAFVFRPAPQTSPVSAGPAPTSTEAAAADQNLADVDSMIAKVEQRVAQNPNGEDFRMIGWSYLNTGRPEKAVEPYRQAAKLLPNRADVLSGYGEALTLSSGEKVSSEAKSLFDKALAIEPKEPRARFFIGLYKTQNGKEREALDDWISLANGSASDLPWQADLRKRVEALGSKLGVDLKGRVTVPVAGAAKVAGPDEATMAAAQNLPPEDQKQMIDGMVEGLAAKLKANPGDAEGWAKLIRSRVVLKQTDKAHADLASARKALANKPEALKLLDALASELGL